MRERFTISKLKDAEIHLVPFHTSREVQSRNGRFNNKFSLRFYLPKNGIKNGSIDRLFIFLNGFAEATTDFWDAIGNNIAKAGAASVLVPLPDHFCRNIFFNMENFNEEDPYYLPIETINLKSFSKIMKQTLIKDPGLFLRYNQQIQGDLHKLITAIKNPEMSDVSISEFTKETFADKIRVSIMGYSLGGLCALQCYLSHTELFNSCVLLNSGASFQDMDGSSMFGKEEWKELQRGLIRVSHEMREKASKNYFSHVILGHAKVELHDLLEKNCHKILVLLGGTDRIINYRSMNNLEPHDTGLAIFQIPGLEHHINIKSVSGREWQAWSDFAVKMILSFEKNRPLSPAKPKVLSMLEH